MASPLSTVVTDFRRDNPSTTSDIPDAVFVRYYNDGRDILIDRIINEKEDYFYDELTTDLVAGQREYAMPKRGDLATDGVTVLNGVAKTKSVSVKWTTDGEYQKLPPNVQENMSADVSQYADGTNAFYTLSDTSHFIYPTPENDVTDGLKLYVITYPKQLALGDTDTLPDNYTKAILLYVSSRFYHSTKEWDVSNLFDAKWNAELSRIAKSLSGRIQSPKQITTPNLRRYS